MPATLTIQLNGQQRIFAEPTSPFYLSNVIKTLDLKGDRIAVERNGEIVPRTAWAQVQIIEGDRLEIVHFVGGGTASNTIPKQLI